MFVDARGIGEGEELEADLCVVGAGPAGLTLVRELAGTPLRIVLLESGARDFDPDVQDLARGENVGRTYFDLDVTRLRLFGGTSNHWGGRCLPLTDHDFAARPWIRDSGWPIDRRDLDPYYRRAHGLIGLGSYDYDCDAVARVLSQPLFPFDPAAVLSVLTRNQALLFGAALEDEVAESEAVRCLLRAHVLGLDTDASGTTVERARVATLGGNRFTVRAKRFVLAAGGLENPRILRLSTAGGAWPNGLGNANDLVGRYFMEHLLYYGGLIAIHRRGEEFPLYNEFLDHEGATVQATLALPPEVLEEHGIANVYFELQGQRGYGFTPAIASTRAIAESFQNLHWPRDFVEHMANMIDGADTLIDAGAKLLFDKPLIHEQDPLAFRVYYYGEQVPNRDSRVLLADDTDAFGLPRLRLDWRITEADIESTRIGHELLAREVGRSGLGRMRVHLHLDHKPPLPHLAGGHHHMGTTRMSADARTGVVDRNCRLHGVENLFVAGSSVFPTVGYANPTLTIVALAMRLADHLKET